MAGGLELRMRGKHTLSVFLAGNAHAPLTCATPSLNTCSPVLFSYLTGDPPQTRAIVRTLSIAITPSKHLWIDGLPGKRATEIGGRFPLVDGAELLLGEALAVARHEALQVGDLRHLAGELPDVARRRHAATGDDAEGVAERARLHRRAVG